VKTYHIFLITNNGHSTKAIDVEGISLARMGSEIKRIVSKHAIPLTSTLHIVDEDTRQVYFRNVLSSVQSILL
jgi:hypothetical protein